MGPEAASVAALGNAAERLRRSGQTELAVLAEADREQFLAKCDLMDGSWLRRAGVLLFGSSEALRSVAPSWGAILTTAPTPGSEVAVLLRRDDAARMPLTLLIDDLLARISALASSETIRVGASEVALVDYPNDLARELVANAFAHRDWELPSVIEIAHSPESLTIASPGGLLPTLRVDRLLRETGRRNELLARTIARLRISEGAGLGFDRVWRGLVALGKEPPRLEDGPRFTAIVPGGRGDQAFARFIAGPALTAAGLADDLEVLLSVGVLRRRRTVNAPGLATRLQRDEAGAQRVLERMRDGGVVEPTQGTARRQFPSYRLTHSVAAALRGALTYHADSIDSDDAKLLRHLERHGVISNADVRGYLDCDVQTARNRLVRLRRKGWIDFAPGSPRRGPKVEYHATLRGGENRTR